MSTSEMPKIEKGEETVFLYKWYIDFYNTDNEKAEHINPVYLESMGILKNFKSENIPRIVSKMKFRLKDILIMKDWQKSCLVDITCKMLVYSQTDNNAMTQVDSKIIFSTTFIPIFNSSTFKSKYKQEDIEKMEEEPSSDLNTGEVSVSMLLLNATAQNALKTVFNSVIDEGNTVGTAIQWMTCELPISGAIIDTPDNDGKQKDIIIPPMSYVQAMNFIQSNYGIYENGLMIFYDIDGILYVLDKYSYEHDCVKGASTLTKLFKTEVDEKTIGSTVRKMDKDNPQYIGSLIINHDQNEVLNGEMTGKTIVFSSFQQGLDSIKYTKQSSPSGSNVSAALTRNVPTNKVSGDKILTEYDELNNIFNMSSYFNELEATSQKAKARITNVNINDFAPNVIVELGFENVDQNNTYAGKYFLNEASFGFSRSRDAMVAGLGAEDSDKDKYKYAPTVTSCTVDIGISRSIPS